MIYRQNDPLRRSGHRGGCAGGEERGVGGYGGGRGPARRREGECHAEAHADNNHQADSPEYKACSAIFDVAQGTSYVFIVGAL